MALISLKNIGKIYDSNDILTIGTRGINLDLDYNEFVTIEGESGSLTQISCSPYGRYVVFETDKVGTFILSYGGVAFHMPMWGCVLICIAAVVIVGVAVSVTIILVRKKKKVAKAGE